GTYEIDFEAAKFAGGVYYYKLSTDNYSQTKKMVLVK
ncbi:MAG: peptidase S8, partial [Ignavibacteria bacterium]|nr:peptidase S8 [Ignavibacteria bacterium]